MSQIKVFAVLCCASACTWLPLRCNRELSFLLLSCESSVPAPQRQSAKPTSTNLSGAALISSEVSIPLAPMGLHAAPSGTSERARQQVKTTGEGA